MEKLRKILIVLGVLVAVGALIGLTTTLSGIVLSCAIAIPHLFASFRFYGRHPKAWIDGMIASEILMILKVIELLLHGLSVGSIIFLVVALAENIISICYFTKTS